MNSFLPLLLLAPLLSPAPAQDTSPFQRALALAERSLESGDLERARDEIRRAQERDPRSVKGWTLRVRWAEAAGDADELVYALHREHQLTVAQGLKKTERKALEERLCTVDPIARDLLGLKDRFVGRLRAVAEAYEEDERPHSAIRVLKEVLALDPENAESAAAIERIASAPDPSLAGDAKPKDLLADVDAEWIAEHDAAHAEWKTRASLERENYLTETDAGYEVLVYASEAMEQMNAFYRQFFQYGTEEDGRNPSRIRLLIFRDKDEYMKLGSGPPEWSAGIFTGGSVETFIGDGGFEDMTGTLFHEAAHQFVSLATNAAGWLNEGLASFFEGCRILSNGTVLMNLPATHRLFPLVERMERGWMASVTDGFDPEDPNRDPEKAPTFRIVLENQYTWGPPWYAPTWGVVYFLYNFEDPVDGRFIYRDAFREFIDASGGRVGAGAVANFEEVVLANPKPPTKGVASSRGDLPRTVDELDRVWKDWLVRLADEVGGRVEVERPYLAWARYAIERGDVGDAVEHFEKGLVETPDDHELLAEFAELLAAERDDVDRAAKLVRGAIRAVESAAAEAAGAEDGKVHEARLDELEKLLVRYDPEQRSLAGVRADLAREAETLVQRYLAAELYLQGMDLAQRMGTDFEVPGMFAYFEEAARRSGKTLAMWKLAYNEVDLEGWAEMGDTFQPAGDVLKGAFNGESQFDFRFLVLDQVTSGDFSMEAEIAVEKGRCEFAGLVFGRKTLTDCHAAILFPPGFDADGKAKAGYVDLTSFHGDTAFDVWRHTPVPETRDASASRSDTWRKLRVDVTGRDVDVWLDGEYLASHTFGSLGVLRGSFGLMQGPGDASYRNVRFLARAARDPGAAIERALRMESIAGAGGSRGTSWVGIQPPFPSVKRWIGEPRSNWEERAGRPQLLVLWSIGQNDQIRLDQWLDHLARKYSPVGLEIVSIVNTWDDANVDAYLATRPFPGSVGVDALDPETGMGSAFGGFFVERFNLPRMLLIDVDGKVAWEGDPGFKVGNPWRTGDSSYVDAPLADLVVMRHLRELGEWRHAWETAALPAMARGDVTAALPALLEGAELDWRLGPEVLEAHARINVLKTACADPAAFAEPLVGAGREPALAALERWGEPLGLPVDLGAKHLKPFQRTDASRDWTKALKAIAPQAKKHADGKELGRMQPLYDKLADLSGPFPAELLAELQAAEADGETALGRVLASAEELPGRWVAREVFGW
jgi:Tfp pilus assembly protein PilF